MTATEIYTKTKTQSGHEIVVQRITGLHILNASKLSLRDPMNYSYYIITESTTIDGKEITFEDLMLMDGSLVIEIMELISIQLINLKNL